MWDALFTSRKSFMWISEDEGYQTPTKKTEVFGKLARSTPFLLVSKVQDLTLYLCDLQFVKDAFRDHPGIAYFPKHFHLTWNVFLNPKYRTPKLPSYNEFVWKLACTVESATFQFFRSSGEKYKLSSQNGLPSTIAKQLTHFRRAFAWSQDFIYGQTMNRFWNLGGCFPLFRAD